MPDYLDFLKNPEAYPDRPDKVDLLQTHISYVFLAGSHVYKIKKPVDFGFLDFTTLAKRKYYCEEELRLNRRLCPDIYLEVVPIKRTDKIFYLGGAMGETVEYAVKMVRMPAEGMMDRVIETGQFTPGMLARITDILVPFYEKAETGGQITKAGDRDGIAENVLENFRQTEKFIGCPVLCRRDFEVIRSYAEKFLANVELLQQRQEEGWIRDGHGDLHSANICFGDKVWIFDCIEFNSRLRYGDVAGDVAFLAMDLDFRGLEEYSARLIADFSKRMGDPGLGTMLNFYKCYRAYVRGKIGLLTGRAAEVDETTKATNLNRAARYFALALRYAEKG